MNKIQYIFFLLLACLLSQSTMAEAQTHLLNELLEDAIHNSGDHALQLTETVLRKRAQKDISQQDRKAARDANEKGLAAIEINDLKTAARWFEEGVKANSGDVEILNNLGYVYLLQNRPEAPDRLREALMFDPRRVNAWVNLGQYFAAQNNIDSAAGCFTLGLRFSNHRDKTIAFLQQLPSKFPSPAMSQAIQKTLQQNWLMPIKENLEKRYIKTRDNFMRQSAKQREYEYTEQALFELEKQLEIIISPIDIEGFPRQGVITFSTAILVGQHFYMPDGLCFQSKNGSLVVTTKKLLENYYERDRGENYLKKRGGFSAIDFWRDEELLFRLDGGDAGVTRYVDIPIKSKGQYFSKAFLGVFTQDDGVASAPNILFISVLKNNKIFFVSAGSNVETNEIPQCLNNREKVLETPELYYRCFEKEAPKQPFFPLVTKQAQSIVDRILASTAQ